MRTRTQATHRMRTHRRGGTCCSRGTDSLGCRRCAQGTTHSTWRYDHRSQYWDAPPQPLKENKRIQHPNSKRVQSSKQPRLHCSSPLRCCAHMCPFPSVYRRAEQQGASKFGNMPFLCLPPRTLAHCSASPLLVIREGKRAAKQHHMSLR